jgi:hypothetical protein
MPKTKTKTSQSSNEIVCDREIPLTSLSLDSTLNNDQSYQSSIATTSTLPRVYGRAQVIQVPARKPTPKPSNSYTFSKRQFYVIIAVVSVCMVAFVAGTVYLAIGEMKVKDSGGGLKVIPVGGNGTFAGNDNVWEVFQVSGASRRDLEWGSGIGGVLLGLAVLVMVGGLL